MNYIKKMARGCCSCLNLEASLQSKLIDMVSRKLEELTGDPDNPLNLKEAAKIVSEKLDEIISLMLDNGKTHYIPEKRNVIRYLASAKLTETTSEFNSGLHTNAFNTTIVSHTFENGKGEIVFAGNVTSIGDNAFSNCSGLNSIDIPSSVTNIGQYAFSNCSGLTSIISNASTAPTISAYTFQDVKTNGILYVPNGSSGYNTWMKTDDYYLGKYDWTKVGESNDDSSSGSGSGSGSSKPVLEGNKLLCKYNVIDPTRGAISLYHPSSGSGSGSGSGSDSGDTPMFSSMEIDGVEQEVSNSYTFNTAGEHTVLFTLPEGVTSISDNAFLDCSELTSVTIGNLVTSIGDSAFQDCYGLTSITIPDSVTSIDQNAFVYCYALTSITIPDSVTSIGDSAFQYCSGLTSIAIPNTVTSIGEYTFQGCSRLTSITIPNSVTSIGNGAFHGCTSFTSITIPSSVTSIGTETFYNCSGLTSITIPNSVTSIGASAFYNCSGLTSITISNSVTSIGSTSFSYCSSLTSITCNATSAPTITADTFIGVKTGGTLRVPVGSTGYNVWMGTGNYYLGSKNWNKVEQ